MAGEPRECGLSIKTLRRAKDALGITARRTEFEKGKAHWSWSLPGGSDGEAERPAGEMETARLYAAG
jgi:hypothetical protein